MNNKQINNDGVVGGSAPTIQAKKINNIEIKPNKEIEKVDKTKFKCYDFFPSLYNTVFICSKRNSGKTTILSNIIDKCTDKKTEFFIFCPTFNHDITWKNILKKLDKKGNIVNKFYSMMEGKFNLLQEIVDTLEKDVSFDSDTNSDSESDKGETPLKTPRLAFPEGVLGGRKTPKYKPKKISPKYVFILDDIGNETKHNQALIQLLKISRHLKADIYICSQYIHDLQLQSIKQIGYMLLFKNFNDEKLEHIYNQLDLSISFEDFLRLYKYIFSNEKEKYNFMYINVRDGEFRKNFDIQLLIKG